MKTYHISLQTMKYDPTGPMDSHQNIKADTFGPALSEWLVNHGYKVHDNDRIHVIQGTFYLVFNALCDNPTIEHVRPI